MILTIITIIMICIIYINTIAVSGGIVGLALGGPPLALLFAALSNYVAKKDDEDDAATFLRWERKTFRNLEV